MKYVINIPDADVSRWVAEKPLLIGKTLYIPISIEDGKKYSITPEIYAEEYTELDRKGIEEEVWKFAKKVRLESFIDEEGRLRGYISGFDSYSEAKAKYEAWKKQKDEICVGDEVVYHGNKYIVGYVGANEVYHIVDRNWIRVVVQGNYQILKTGRHFDEIEELLKKMKKGNENK